MCDPGDQLRVMRHVGLDQESRRAVPVDTDKCHRRSAEEAVDVVFAVGEVELVLTEKKNMLKMWILKKLNNKKKLEA